MCGTRRSYSISITGHMQLDGCDPDEVNQYMRLLNLIAEYARIVS
jgi:hypothetical protein